LPQPYALSPLPPRAHAAALPLRCGQHPLPVSPFPQPLSAGPHRGPLFQPQLSFAQPQLSPFPPESAQLPPATVPPQLRHDAALQRPPKLSPAPRAPPPQPQPPLPHASSQPSHALLPQSPPLPAPHFP